MRKVCMFTGRLAALILAVGLLVTAAHAAESAQTFSDVPADAWYAEAVQYVSQQGLMVGTGGTAFSPDVPLTRGMLATILYRADGSPSLEGENLGDPFADVEGDSWYADGVYWARLAGLVTGYSSERFGPDDPVTREQLVTVLWRAAGTPSAESASAFADALAISDWAVDGVAWAVEAGLVSGKPGNLFDPAGQATRAEASVILARYDQQREAAEEEPEDSEELMEPEALDDPEESAALLPNSYDSAAFVVENGFLTYQGDAPSYVGIDVSAHQGEVDWERVAAAGVDFVMLRVGYRGYTLGSIYQDAYFTYNITGALDAGLDVGIYFFSQAVSEAEAMEEARQTLAWIAGYDITYPVVFDWERISGPSSRTRSTTGETVTACARAFCEVVQAAGYTPMVYGNPSDVRDGDLLLEQLTDYPFWLAHYTDGWTPTTFPYHYQMWQYTSDGTVDGIAGRVDLNLCLTDWP